MPMQESASIVLGSSFLPSKISNCSSFVSRAAMAIRRNPDCAAEITLAASKQLLETQQDPSRLRTTLLQLIDASCKARDESTLA